MSSNYPIIKNLGITPTAADITLNTGGFTNILGAGDIDVQQAMDTIDDMSILDINDTPASFTANYLAIVNSAGNALEFTNAIPSGTTGVTQSPLDNSTLLATTAYVDAAVLVEDLWDRSGTELSPKTSGDSINTTAFYSIGGVKFIHDPTAIADTFDSLGVGTTSLDNYIGGGSGGNIAVGSQALDNSTTGEFNTAIGTRALAGATTQSNSTAIGFEALLSGGGGAVVAIGDRAMRSNTGNLNTAIGQLALSQASAASSCTIVGADSAQYLTGNTNTFYGTRAGRNATTTAASVLIGGSSGTNINSGTINTFVGTSSGGGVTTGEYNTGVGYNIMSGSNGSRNAVFGMTALQTGGSFNCAFGYDAGRYSTGSSNVFIGYQAGQNAGAASNVLYIANSNTTTPLIYGEFDNDFLQINGDLHAEQVINFTSYNNATPQAGDVWYEDHHLHFTPVADERIITCGNGTITSDTTVANTVTETTVNTIGISANELHAEELIKVRILGYYSTANSSDTFTARIKIGGTTIASLVSVAKNATNEGLDVEFIGTVRTIGASGTVRGHAHGLFAKETVVTPGTSDVTVDTTTSNDVTLTIEWSAADASNTLTVTQSMIEFIG